MTEAVLDASALIALIRGEPGGTKVAESIGRARISAVNFAEVIGYLTDRGMLPDAVDEMLRPLSLAIVDADPGLGRAAGFLRAETRKAGLSLGDRFCLALAAREGLPAWTADRQWLSIAEAADVEIVLIR